MPAMSSRHGSLVSMVSLTKVSHMSTPCSRRISTAWSSFSWTRVDVAGTAADGISASSTLEDGLEAGIARDRHLRGAQRVQQPPVVSYAATDTEEHRVEQREPEAVALQRDDLQPGA